MTLVQDQLLFDPSRIEVAMLESYLEEIVKIWPEQFEYREEIALQFLHESLHYRVSGYTASEALDVSQRLRTFLNDLRLENRSHSCVVLVTNSRHKVIKTVISPV